MSTLGKRIKHRRQELGLSQDELAKKLGYKSRSAINKIELGKNDVSQSKLQKFAEALDTTTYFLVSGQEEPSYEVPSKYLIMYDDFLEQYPEETTKYFSNLCNLERKNKNIPLDYICDNANINIVQYEKFEAGEIIFDKEVLVSILDSLGLNFDDAINVLETVLEYEHRDDPFFIKLRDSRPDNLRKILDMIFSLDPESLEELKFQLDEKYDSKYKIPKVYHDAIHDTEEER